MKLENRVPRNEFLQGVRAAARSSARASALLEVLDARGLAVSAAQREIIEACTDEELLGQWLRRAVVATSTADLFVD